VPCEDTSCQGLPRRAKRRFNRAHERLADLIQLIWDRTIDPGKVFDLTLPLEEAAQGYKAMDERRATKVLLTF
jgi:threonine dehydrogenase-like Zn-dependent dehydrogenase